MIHRKLQYQLNLFLVGNKRFSLDHKYQIRTFYALPRQCFFETQNFKLICFGHNENGQLADGTTKRRVRCTPTNITGITKGITGNGYFTAIIDSPFDESLLSIDYKQLTPSDLSYPLEMNEDLFSYKE